MKIHSHGNADNAPGHQIDKPGGGPQKKEFAEYIDEETQAETAREAELAEEEAERQAQERAEEEEQERRIEEYRNQQRLQQLQQHAHNAKTAKTKEVDQKSDVFEEVEEDTQDQKVTTNNVETEHVAVKAQKLGKKGDVEIKRDFLGQAPVKQPKQQIFMARTTGLPQNQAPGYKGKGMNDQGFPKIGSTSSEIVQENQTDSPKGPKEFKQGDQGQFGELLTNEGTGQPLKAKIAENVQTNLNTQTGQNTQTTQEIKTTQYADGSQNTQTQNTQSQDTQAQSSVGQSAFAQSGQNAGETGQSQGTINPQNVQSPEHPQHPDHPLGGPPGLQKKTDGLPPGQVEEVEAVEGKKSTDKIAPADVSLGDKSANLQGLPISAYFPHEQVTEIKPMTPAAGDLRIPQIEQIVERIVTGINASGNPELKMDLHLAELGKVNVNITSAEAGLVIQLNADTEKGGLQLGQNMQALYNALSEKALNINNIQVMIQNQPVPLSELIDFYKPTADSRVSRKESTGRASNESKQKKQQQPPKGVKGA